MGLHLYIGETDYIPWADRTAVQNASLAMAQGVVEQFSIGLQNYKTYDPDTMISGLLPPLPAGHAPVMYIDVIDELDPSTYDVLFSGIMLSIDGTDASWTGMTQVAVATPMKFLKMVIHSMVFVQTVYPTDTSRIRAIGVKLEGQLPDWDFSTYVAADDAGNITYPPFNWPPHNDGTDADEFTQYSEQTVEDTIRAIANDPGWFTDVLYPVQARNWWVEGDFNILGDPTSGVTWYVHYQNVPTPDTIYDFMDAPSVDFPDGIIYDSGATYNIDYTKVIRKINIAGPASFPGQLTWGPLPIVWNVTKAKNVRMGSGIIFKNAGADGQWDAAAIGTIPHWDDLEVQCQCQELYLQHDTFQRADGANPDHPGLGVSYHGDPYEVLNNDFPMAIRNQHATSQYRPRVGRTDNICYGILDCYASTCILRSHFAVNQEGMRLIFRWQDYHNYWYVSADASGYSVNKFVGDSVVDSWPIDVVRHDMQEVKVNLLNIGDDLHHYIQVYVDDVIYVGDAGSLDDDTFAHSTFHGICINCDAFPDAWLGEFYDFSCSHFWGDKAFGIGDSLMTPDDGHGGFTLPTWEYMSFGFVFNSDATMRIVHDAVPISPSLWNYPSENDYTYNDRFKIVTVNYMDPDSRSLKRKVQWQKQSGGEGDWLILYEIAPAEEPLLNGTHPWYVQYAGKEKGAVLDNMLAGRSYSNLFVAPSPPYSVLYGGPNLYPATGLLQSDFWDTYVKRQRIADAIFVAQAEPTITFTATTGYHLIRGMFVRVTNRRAGWVDNTGVVGTDGLDHRPILICSRAQRVETGNPRKPRYSGSFGYYMYSNDDPGRVHLLEPNTIEARLTDSANRLDPYFDGVSLSFDDAVVTGVTQNAHQIQVQVMPVDQQALYNQVWPTTTFEWPTTRVMLPTSWLPPNTALTERHRLIGPAGASQWSKTTPFTTPPQLATDRMSTLMWYIGNGVDPITNIGPDNIYDEAIINQPCSLVMWAADLASVVGDMEYDVQYCTAQDRRQYGVAAFQSLIFHGTRPAIVYDGGGSDMTNDGTFNDSYDMRGWDDRAFTMNAGDRVRILVTSADTLATKGTFDLMFAARNVPYSNQGGTPGTPIPDTMEDPDGSALTDDDGAPLTG